MDMWVVVGDTENKYLTLVVTPYKKSCSPGDAHYIQCDNNKHCVRKDLFCDGRINCAWPHSVPADESQCKEVAPPVEPEKNDNTTGIVLTVLAFLAVSVLSVGYLFYKRRNNQPPKLATQIITRPLQGQEDLLTTGMCGDLSHQPLHPPPYAATPSAPPPAVPARQPPRYEVIWT